MKTKSLTLILAVLSFMMIGSLSASAQTRCPDQTRAHGNGFGGGPRSETYVTVDFINARTAVVACYGSSDVFLYLTDEEYNVLDFYTVAGGCEETVRINQTNGTFHLIASAWDGYWNEWTININRHNVSTFEPWSRTSL